jgi:ssRNA-specific RNase YbeY (16S rRNA maturation enzyme)
MYQQFPVVTLGDKRQMRPTHAELVFVFEMIQEEYEEQGRSLPEDVELVIANTS